MTTIDKVNSVRAMQEPGSYLLNINVTDSYGVSELGVDYVSRPDDLYGYAPLVREWLENNKGKYKIIPYEG